MQVVYGDGPVLSNIQVVPVYLTLDLVQRDGHVVHFGPSEAALCNGYRMLTDIANSPYLDLLGQECSGQQGCRNIGRGSCTDKWVVDAGSFNSDALNPDNDPYLLQGILLGDLETALGSLVDQHQLPQPTSDTCYFVFPPSGLSVDGVDGHPVVAPGWVNRFVSPDGYTVVYAGFQPWAYTGELQFAISQQIVEAVTNPQGGGWSVEYPGPPSESVYLVGACFPPKTSTLHGYPVTAFYGPKSGQCVVLPDDGSKSEWFLPTKGKVRVISGANCWGSIPERSKAVFGVDVPFGTVITNYIWSVDNFQSLSPGQTLSVETPAAPGQITVFVELIDAKGCHFTASQTFPVWTNAEVEQQSRICELLWKMSHQARSLPPVPFLPWFGNLRRDFSRTPLSHQERQSLSAYPRLFRELAQLFDQLAPS